jgi:hypothetical protein
VKRVEKSLSTHRIIHIVLWLKLLSRERTQSSNSSEIGQDADKSNPSISQVISDTWIQLGAPNPLSQKGGAEQLQKFSAPSTRILHKSYVTLVPVKILRRIFYTWSVFTRGAFHKY